MLVMKLFKFTRKKTQTLKGVHLIVGRDKDTVFVVTLMSQKSDKHYSCGVHTHHVHLGECSRDAMYRVQESNYYSKLKLFHWLFIELSYHILWP